MPKPAVLLVNVAGPMKPASRTIRTFGLMECDELSPLWEISERPFSVLVFPDGCGGWPGLD